MVERPKVFVTHAMEGLATAARSTNPLDRLRRETACRVWHGEGPPPREALLRGVAESQGLLCLLTDRIDAELIAAAPRLRVISSCSVGVDHIDLAAAAERGIEIANTPGVLTETTADLAFALLLAAARRVVEADDYLRGGGWTPERAWELDGFLGQDVHDATLGLIGLGPIGQAVARRARGFGMRVLGWTRSGRSVDGIEPVSFERAVAESDFLSIHVALTDETRGLIDRDVIARMRPGAILVNTARGGIVDELALVDALRSGALGGAGLDVFEAEPKVSAGLLEMENVVLLPHLGSATRETRIAMGLRVLENALAFFSGAEPPDRVV